MIKLLTLGLMTGTLLFTPVQSNISNETSIVLTSEEASSEVEQSSVEIEENEENAKFDFGEWLEKNFTAEMITTIMSVLTSLAVVLKLASSLKDLAKKKAMTTEEVCNKVVEILETTNKESVLKSINDIVKPLEDKVGDITPVLNSFSKILALSQENTPESRLAILELIQSIGNISNKVVEDAKTEIVNQIEEEQKENKENIAILESIEEKNNTKSGEGRY